MNMLDIQRVYDAQIVLLLNTAIKAHKELMFAKKQGWCSATMYRARERRNLALQAIREFKNHE